jgi:hypothetical protein
MLPLTYSFERYACQQKIKLYLKVNIEVSTLVKGSLLAYKLRDIELSKVYHKFKGTLPLSSRISLGYPGIFHDMAGNQLKKARHSRSFASVPLALLSPSPLPRSN